MPVHKLPPRIHAILQCQLLDWSFGTLSESCSVLDATCFPQELISYHRSRSMICSFLSTIYPLSEREEHTPISSTQSLSTKRQELEALIANYPQGRCKTNSTKAWLRTYRAKFVSLLQRSISPGGVSIFYNPSRARTLSSYAILSKIRGHYNTARIHCCLKSVEVD
jgi:hypothetical protein